MKQPDPADHCPYCHKLFVEENLGCRLAHEHGKHPLSRERRPSYSELEDQNDALGRLLRSGVDTVTRLLRQPAEVGYFRTPRETRERSEQVDAWLQNAVAFLARQDEEKP